jgi:GDSL-like Lipase/Acylhydrolase family
MAVRDGRARPRPHGALVLFGVLLAMLASAAFANAASAAPNYVSLGDSYVAGPFIPLQLPPFGCLKSDHNYPHLAAPAIGLPLRDPSCSGAKTDHMTQTQNVNPGPNPPQFDSLDADTQVVTLGIGGNDIGFSSIAKDCFSTQQHGSPCKDKYTAGGTDQISARIQNTAPKVDAVIQGIHSRSPNAKVYVVNYPAILPDQGPGCWPVMPVADGDVPYVRDKEKELNAMLASEAAANTASVVDWYTNSIGHDACQPPGIKWVEGPVPLNAAAPVHPNLLGMMAASDLVVAAVKTG